MDLDLVDGVRLFGATSFGFAAAYSYCVSEPGLGVSATATAVVTIVHLAITIASRPRPHPRGDAESEANGKGTDPWAKHVAVLGKELQERLVDEEARNRDVTKQYVALAGVSLTILAALGDKRPTEILVGASSLGASIALGLILLERLTGSTLVRFGHYAISIMYHLMCWSLLFGLLSILVSLWA